MLLKSAARCLSQIVNSSHVLRFASNGPQAMQLSAELLQDTRVARHLDRILSRRLQLKEETDQLAMAEHTDTVELAKRGRLLARSASLAFAVQARIDAQKAVRELEELAEDPDKEMQNMAREELRDAWEELNRKELEVLQSLVPVDDADAGSAVLEIRAGTGGREAALFAADLFKMYQLLASKQKWKLQVLEESITDDGGYKEIIANVSGNGVFGMLKYESGVHRVQRVPSTENQGRVHTSAATVAILPEPSEVDVELHERDVRMETFRAGGAGGQHVNTTDSAVRLTHVPTGLIVECQVERSQHQNRARAMKILGARLYAMERERLEKERIERRRALIGGTPGARSDRIRTYNYPQDRLTDHRVNLKFSLADVIIAGDSLNALIRNLHQFFNIEELMADVEESEAEEKMAK